LQAGRAEKLFYVRINPLSGPHALTDLAAVMPGRPDGIMLPKATPAALARLDHNLEALEAANGIAIGATRVVAIATETAGAMFELGHFAGVAPRLAALTWGAEDLAADLGAGGNRRDDGVYDDTFRLARALALLGAQAAGVLAIDTVYVDYRNTEGLQTECRAARRAGFVGKMAIHPDQVATINAAFTPTEAQREWAHGVVAAFAANPDAGTVGIDGKMIDRPHLLIAERILRT
jgi:citrate lyase subunit beta/citryl-CoA lyase